MPRPHNTSPGPNPSGLCMCGCGGFTTIAKKTDAKRGLIVGQPTKYIVGHNAKMNVDGKSKRCNTCKRNLPWSSFDRYETCRALHGSCRNCRKERERDTSVPVDEIDPGFGHWLSGFIDGEGSFVIAESRGQFRCVFSLTLRDDDHDMLVECEKQTGIGSVSRRDRSYGKGPDRPQSVWVVTNVRDCLALVRLLDRFPLRAKKRRDYEIWRQAVIHWRYRPVGSRWHHNVDWTTFADFKRDLEAVRRYVPLADR